MLGSIKDNAFNYKEPADIEAKFPSEREPTSLMGRFKKKVGQIRGATKVEYIADKLDGFKGKAYEIEGKAYDLIFKPRVDAEKTQLKLTESDVDVINKAIEPIKKNFKKMLTDKVDVGGREITRMEAIAVYWNSLNEGNRKALEKGFALSPEAVDKIVKTITKEEKTFANDILKLIQSKGPDVAKVLKNLTGENMKFEKNYFPLWFDFELSEKMAERQQAQDLMKQVYSKVGAEKGFTITRKGGTEAPYLSFDVVLKHLAAVNHFIASAEAIRDVQKVVLDKDVRRSIEANAGEGQYKEIVEWMKDWGNPRKGDMGQLDRAFGLLRRNTTLVALGFKVSTSILQPTAYLQLINRIGLKNSMVGLADFYKHPIENRNLIYDLSPTMKARSHSFDRDLKDFLDKDGFYSKHAKLKEFAMGMVGQMDLATTLPAWHSAYNLAMKQYGWDQSKAVDYADKIVRTTQGSGLSKDFAGVLRGSEFKKSLVMFYTYFSSTYNEAKRDVGAFRAGEEGITDLAKSFMWLFVIPAAIQVAMKKREQTTAGEFGRELVGNMAGTVPYLGPIMNAALYGFDYQASPVFEFPEEVMKTFSSKEPETKLKHGVMAAGYATGFPSRQAILTTQYLADVLEGKDYDPTNLIYREYKKKKGGW